MHWRNEHALVCSEESRRGSVINAGRVVLAILGDDCRKGLHQQLALVRVARRRRRRGSMVVRREHTRLLLVWRLGRRNGQLNTAPRECVGPGLQSASHEHWRDCC